MTATEARRQQLKAALIERFCGDGPAIGRWLKETFEVERFPMLTDEQVREGLDRLGADGFDFDLEFERQQALEPVRDLEGFPIPNPPTADGEPQPRSRRELLVAVEAAENRYWPKMSDRRCKGQAARRDHGVPELDQDCSTEELQAWLDVMNGWLAAREARAAA